MYLASTSLSVRFSSRVAAGERRACRSPGMGVLLRSVVPFCLFLQLRQCLGFQPGYLTSVASGTSNVFPQSWQVKLATSLLTLPGFRAPAQAPRSPDIAGKNFPTPIHHKDTKDAKNRKGFLRVFVSSW